MSLEPGLVLGLSDEQAKTRSLQLKKSGKNYQVLTNVEFKKGEVIDIVTKNLTKATLGQLELAEPQEKTLRQRKRLLLRNLRLQPNLLRQNHRRKRLNRKKQNKQKNLKMFDFDKFINRPCIGEGLGRGHFRQKSPLYP